MVANDAKCPKFRKVRDEAWTQRQAQAERSARTLKRNAPGFKSGLANIMSFNNMSDGATEASVTNLMGTNPSSGALQQSGGQQYSLSQFRAPAQYHRHSVSNSKSA
jgi:hypothetical protein